MALDVITTVALIGVVLGVILRTFFPYLRKLEKAGEKINFDWKRYGVSFLISLIVFGYLALWAVNSFPGAEGNPLEVFLAGLTFGMVGNHVANIPVDWLKARAERMLSG